MGGRSAMIPGERRNKSPVMLPDLPLRDDPFSEGVVLPSCIYCDHRLIEDATVTIAEFPPRRFTHLL